MLNKFGKADILKENLIDGAELTGEFDFPVLRAVDYLPEQVIPFSAAVSERHPRGKWVHFFVDDEKFERAWNQPDKYLGILQYFDGVITPDFSSYLDMPKSCAIWNTYRNRVLAYYYQNMGLRIIPTVGWMDEASYSWCFDGLPKHSTLAVSTNGCFFPEGKQFYTAGITEMKRRLEPNRIIVVGRPIDVPIETELVYFDSFGQEMTGRLRGVSDKQ